MTRVSEILLLVESNAKIPKMEVPGCKVTMPYGWSAELTDAIKKLKFSVARSGDEDASTKYSVAFHIDKNFDIEKFTDELRKELNFSGYMQVQFLDLVEED